MVREPEPATRRKRKRRRLGSTPLPLAWRRVGAAQARSLSAAGDPQPLEVAALFREAGS
jgi:hypothetical protein